MNEQRILRHRYFGPCGWRGEPGSVALVSDYGCALAQMARQLLSRTPGCDLILGSESVPLVRLYAQIEAVTPSAIVLATSSPTLTAGLLSRYTCPIVCLGDHGPFAGAVPLAILDELRRLGVGSVTLLGATPAVTVDLLRGAGIHVHMAAIMYEHRFDALSGVTIHATPDGALTACGNVVLLGDGGLGDIGRYASDTGTRPRLFTACAEDPPDGVEVVQLQLADRVAAMLAPVMAG